MKMRDTVVAIATAPGRGGLGVVRLSGAQSSEIAERIVRFGGPPRWRSWSSEFGQLLDFEGSIVDQVVVSFFKAPRSYTGEDVVEIACHGSPVILRFCLQKAVAEGARLAEPGEFTL